MSASSDTLLRASRAMVESPGRATAGMWPRAAALLARQALEGALDDHWQQRAPGLENASMRAQLACLPDYLGDRRLAADVAFTWGALSGACHHHAYELAPTAPELEGWIESVERLVGAVESSKG
jgi:hypothetical protein